MAQLYKALVLAAALCSTLSFAQNSGSCGGGSKCSKDTPCCSQYGKCGVGAYCLGGCDPLHSFDQNSCVPAPVCKSADYKLTSLDDVQSIDKYLGDPSKANWQSQGKPLVYNGNVLLTMAQDTVGTLLASTHYVWYGKITAKLTTSQGKGVVTAFIMMSDTKDEIDYEIVGADVSTVQSNFYSQGNLDYNNGKNHSTSNTRENEHEYVLDWNPDTITWSLDGKEVRSVKRSDTWNSTTNRFDYPQTPARVMLSLWPAGIPSNGEGTIAWGGGLVDWSSQYMSNGYYYAMIKEVKVECYNPPQNAQIKGKNAYVYGDDKATNSSIQIQDNVQILKSLYATGDNPNYDPDAAASSSSGASKPTNLPENVPGMSGGGNRQEGGQSNSAGAPGATPTDSSGFSQGGNNGGGKKNGAAEVMPRNVGGSVFAVLVAVVALMSL